MEKVDGNLRPELGDTEVEVVDLGDDLVMNEELRRMIQVGLYDLESGDYDEYDEESLLQLAEDIKARGRLRLAAAQKQGL